MGKRGTSDASLANLKRGNPSTQITQRNASAMGKKSAQARMEYRTFRTATREALTPDVMDEIIHKMIEKAKDGDVRAYELLRDTADGKPKQSVDLEQHSETVNFVLNVVEDYKGQKTDVIDMDEISG